MNVPDLYYFLTVVTLVSADWINSPRYGSQYVGGFEVPNSSTPRVARCVPCDERRSAGSSSNSLEEYRGNGADNLGYDWSPKAWGGPAFPNKSRMPTRQNDEWPGSRGGRRMPDVWEERGCQGCSSAERGWGGGSYGDRAGSWERDNHGPSTPRPNGWPTTGAPNEATVTSQVLGIMYRNDKRLPVPWQGDGRSMRWDGFRNGISWEQPMDKRSWNEEPGFRPWDETGKETAGWDSQGKGHYAASWKYGSPTTDSGGSSWNRPWTGSDNRQPDERGYGQSGSLPFGSSYPQQPSNNYPQSSNNYPSSSYPSSSSANYPTDRPTYSTSSWRPTTGAYPPKNQYVYPSTSRPHQPYPEIYHHRPSYQDTKPRPGYQTSPSRPQGEGSWNYNENYDQNRPGQWTTPRPNQNYLPQGASRPGYGSEKPPIGVPSITIWNGQSNSYDRPGKPPKGVYTGFITELHDSNYVGGNRPSSGYPSSDRYPGGSSGYPPRDPYPSTGGNQYPSSGDRYPSVGGSSYPSSDRDRYPSIGGSSYPSSGDRDRYPSVGGSSYPYSGDRDRYPSIGGSSYPTTGDRDRYPNVGGSSYPSSGDRDRYPNVGGSSYPSSGDRDRYPSTGGSRYPSNDRHPSSGGSTYGNRFDIPSDDKYSSNQPDRNPWYDTDRNRPSYGNDRYPTHGSKYPSSDRYPTYESDRGPSYDKDRYPSQGSDRYPSYGNDGDRYNDRDRFPSRPGSSDHDRGPLPNSDSGSWNYGEEEKNKDGTYKRSGGSYPSYNGGKYFTSSYLASASTPASSNEIEGKKPGSIDETTTASSQEQHV